MITAELIASECILLSHCHFDHTGTAQALKEKYHIPCYCHEREPYMPCDRRLREGDIVTIGSVSLETLHTPNRTPGGLSYRLENLLSCGDTIFRRAMGTTHYRGGDFDTLIRTITQKIFDLPDDTILLPDHGSKTAMGHEKASGFYPTP